MYFFKPKNENIKQTLNKIMHQIEENKNYWIIEIIHQNIQLFTKHKKEDASLNIVGQLILNSNVKDHVFEKEILQNKTYKQERN